MTPRSTYRLQFGPTMTFADAVKLADYLDALGVDALYASPLLTAAPGSTHGYDVVDHTRAEAALGGEPGREQLAARLRELGLGFVVDVVCNHMGVADAAANPLWWDVLANGPASPHARVFDVDWTQGPLRLPVLGDADGQAAPAELTATGDELRYHGHRFPIAPGTNGGSAAEIHARQHYRLVSWRHPDGPGYRRFFNIDTLACVRVEDPDVFDLLHAELLRWVRDGDVTGLRVDHPDGLADPAGYLARLRGLLPETWIVVEKVLAVGEALPSAWPVDGTTGYDALREICGVFVDPAARRPLTELAAEFGERHPDDPVTVRRAARRQVVESLLAPEVRRLADLIGGLSAEPSPADSRKVAAGLLTAFPIYRSYLPEHRWAVEQALDEVAVTAPELADIVATVRAALLADPAGQLATRLQQSTGAVMAKGVEDTAFYRYNRFVAANEVGADLSRFGVSVAELHAANAARDSGWPATMTTLSTHDTKRSEDVRARLAVLSELPDEFAAAARRWSARCPMPDRVLELLAWQTLVGAWPIEEDRFAAFLGKACREARTHTSWTDPDESFEAAVAGWVRRVWSDEDLLADLSGFVGRVRAPGWSNSLSQKLVQLAGPGVPDVYQGTELWDWSLVDPDNRRPVDFALRRALLARIDRGALPEIDETGAAKLLVVTRVLRLRRSAPALFRGYRPLRADGPAADHLVAFARGVDLGLVAVATRLPVALADRGGWADTVLPLPGPADRWTDLISGNHVAGHGVAVLAELLSRYPVALLVRGRR